MSCETHAYIHKNIEPEEIVKALTKIGTKTILRNGKLEYDENGDFFSFIDFTYEGRLYELSITRTSDYIDRSEDNPIIEPDIYTSIGVNYSKKSSEFMVKVLQRFGGYFIENDHTAEGRKARYIKKEIG